MARVTGGSLTIEQTRQLAQFEPRKVAVTLTFGCEEHETDEQAQTFLDTIAARAAGKVMEMLGLERASHAQPSNDAASAGLQSSSPRRTRKPPVTGEGGPASAATEGTRAETAGVVPDPLGLGGAPGNLEPALPPASVPAAGGVENASADPLGLGGSSNTETASAAPEGDIFSGLPGEITDATITLAITDKNHQTKNHLAIRKLIGQYAPPPGHSSKIPQDKRAAFLVELGNISA